MRARNTMIRGALFGAVLAITSTACAAGGPPTLSEEQFFRLTDDLTVAGQRWTHDPTLEERRSLITILPSAQSDSCAGWVEAAQADSGGATPLSGGLALRFSSSETLSRLFQEAKTACSASDDFDLLMTDVSNGVYSATFHASDYDFTVIARGNVAVASFDDSLPVSSAKEIAEQIDAAAR